jgi:hypothetical protein
MWRIALLSLQLTLQKEAIANRLLNPFAQKL